MAYSYAWDVTPKELDESTWPSFPGADAAFYRSFTKDAVATDPMVSEDDSQNEPTHSLLDRYVVLRGEWGFPSIGANIPSSLLMVIERSTETPVAYVFGVHRLNEFQPKKLVCRGRVKWVWPDASAGRLYLVVDMTASRFHGASIAGLVVGAMGVFVVTVALRRWLAERRRFREEARA